jgi:DNA-directed RNA polymerase subunit RPC12/RpoP
MIHVECPRCGQQFTAPDGQTGTETRCPRCKDRITISPESALGPSIISEELLAAPPSPADATGARAPQNSRNQRSVAPSDALDRQLLDVPPTTGGDTRLSDAEVLAKFKFKPAAEYTGERRLPWLLDILLYPANAAGLMNLAIIVCIPVLLTGLQRVVFLPFLGLMFFLARLAIAVYAAWYWAECTADSAKGGTRAPQLLDAAGYGDKWSRVSYLLTVYALFVLPVVLYLVYGGRNAAVVGILFAWALVFFPMGLLAMVVLDGLYVLNPLFLLGAIRRTFGPYAGLLSLVAAVAASVWLMPRAARRGLFSIGLGSLGLFLAGYASLIAAHILGRFYWHYRERLGWDV